MTYSDSPDTSPEAHKKQVEIILAKTPEERFRMGMEMIDLARIMVQDAILRSQPGIDQVTLTCSIFRRYFKNDFSPEQMEQILASIRAYHEN
jgi:hypothetical protein